MGSGGGGTVARRMPGGDGVEHPTTSGFEILEERIRDAHNPEGNPHQPQIPNQYISASKLVKNSAADIASSMLDEIDPDHEDEFPSEYTFLGKTLEEASYEDFDHGEVRLTHPVGDTGWIIAGHCDMIEHVAGEIYVGEHKFHGTVTDRKAEDAKRQGSIYLSMAWSMAKRNGGSATFPQAAYAQDGEAFHWPMGARPAGVLVTVVQPRPPFFYMRRHMDVDACEEVLDFYEAKAKVIVKAVENEDPTIARDEWDDVEPGVFEFNQDYGTPEDIETVRELIDEKEHIKREIDQLEDQKEGLSQQIKSFHDKLDEKSIDLGDGRKSVLIQNPGRKRAKVPVEHLVEVGFDGKAKVPPSEAEDLGLEEYVSRGSPYSYTQTYGSKEEGAE